MNFGVIFTGILALLFFLIGTFIFIYNNKNGINPDILITGIVAFIISMVFFVFAFWINYEESEITQEIIDKYASENAEIPTMVDGTRTYYLILLIIGIMITIIFYFYINRDKYLFLNNKETGELIKLDRQINELKDAIKMYSRQDFSNTEYIKILEETCNTLKQQQTNIYFSKAVKIAKDIECNYKFVNIQKEIDELDAIKQLNYGKGLLMNEHKEQLVKDLYDSNVQADITVEELADDILDDYKHSVIDPILKRKELYNELAEIKTKNPDKKIDHKDTM